MHATSGKLKAKVLSIESIGASMQNDMWILFNRYYADVTRERFDQDLAAKSMVIMLLDTGDKSVQGFSTVEIYNRKIQGKLIRAIYSGDTIISKGYWGQSALSVAFAGVLAKQFLLNKLRPVHWFLISKGYKTYLLMTKNLLHYYPRHDQDTPPWEKAVTDALATEKFGYNWQADKGVLTFSSAAGRVAEGIAPIEQSMIDRNSDIRFFAEKNPGHQNGDELCCLGRIDISTFLHFIKREIRKSSRMVKSSFTTLLSPRKRG